MSESSEKKVNTGAVRKAMSGIESELDILKKVISGLEERLDSYAVPDSPDHPQVFEEEMCQHSLFTASLFTFEDSIRAARQRMESLISRLDL